MSAIPQPSSDFTSDRILAPLRRVAQRQWMILAARGGLQSAIVLLALLLAASLLFGHWQSMPVDLRVFVAGVIWLLIFAGAVRFLRPALRKRRLRHAAFAIEQFVPGMDERISSAVELSEESDARFAGSPALVRRLVEQAESDAARVDPVAVVPATQIKRWAIALAPVLVVWMILLPLMPRPLVRGLVFAFAPWRTDAPAILAEIAVKPGDARIAQGDAFRVEVSVADDTAAGESGPQIIRRFASGQTVARTLDRASNLPAASAKTTSGLSANFENVRESFKYRVEAAGTQTRWFDVTVLSRPSVAKLDVAYDFPAYTGLDDRTDTNADGDLHAIVGTKVFLTVHTSGPVSLADGKSRIVVNKGRRDEQTLGLAPVADAPDRFTASLFVTNSGTYQIHLFSPESLGNGVELWNRDDQPHAIEARFDQPPTVAITSPKPEETVGADDEVPVGFEAGDDFGVALIEAVVQVDDKPVNAFPLELKKYTDRHRIVDEWALSVPYQLARAGVPEATRITYQFRVTDNRDPDAQSVLSAKQTLNIRKDIRDSIATRLDAERTLKLQQSIDQTVQKLDQARPQLEQAKNPAVPLTADQQKLLQATQQQIAQASNDLAKAAAEQEKTALAPVAQKAEQIAAQPIQQAAENAAKAALNPQQGEARVQAATEAQKQIDEAKKELAQLKLDVTAHQAKLETARLIDQAQSIQDQVAAEHAKLAAARQEADAKAQQPNQTPQQQQANQQEQQKLQQQQAALQQRQQESAARIAAAVQKEQALQNAQAVQDAATLAALAQQVTQLQQDQRPLQLQVTRQAELNAAKANAEELAKRQEELNREIDKFAHEQQPALQLAPAQPPTRDAMNNIPAALRQPNVAQANEAQKQAAQQLAQNAQALNAAAKQPDARGPAAEKAKQAAAAEQQANQQAAQQAQQAAQAFDNAAKGKDEKAKAAAEKAALGAAKDLERRAKDAEEQGAQAKKVAEATTQRAKDLAREADAAKQDAEQKMADAQRAAQAAAANPQADPKTLQQAAAAQQTAQAAKQEADAAMESAKAQADAAERAGKAAAAARLAAEAARELAEAASKDVEAGKAADVAPKLQKSAEQLQQAAQQNAAAQQANLAADQQHAAAEAAEEAAKLSQKQSELARDTSPAIAQFQQAQQGLVDPAQVAAQETQLAQRATQAAQAAAQLQQSTAPRNSDFAERAADAQKALKDANDAQAAAAESQTKAAQAQQAIQKANQEAAQAVAQESQAEARADQADVQAHAQEEQAADAMMQAAALAKQAEAAKSAGNDAQAQQLQQQVAQRQQQSQQLQQAAKAPAGQAAEARKAADVAAKQAATARQQAADAQQQAAAAQQASAAHQAEALDALARAENALREPLPPEQLASAKTPAAANGSKDQSPNASPADKSDNAPNESNGTPSDAKQSLQQAAQNVQEAAQAQQQAFNQPQGNALASAEAARALRDAAEAMGKAVPESRRGQRDALANGKQGHPSGKADRAEHPNVEPGQPGESSEGIHSARGDGDGKPDDRPAGVKELGISSADWARLGPLTRQELLNAAQQSGPPAYREAIKNYFVKIARLRSDSEAVSTEVKQ